MRVAIVLFEGFTVLDAVGPYQVFSGVPGVEVVLVGASAGPVLDHVGSARMVAEASFEQVGRADVVVVPGGPGQVHHMDGGPVREWVRAVDATSTWTTSVCTGSLILAAAGLLRGRAATTHWLAVDQLGAWGASVSPERVVFDGKYVSAAGVSAGIDMALALAGRLWGPVMAQTVQLAIEYDPRPPFGAGSPHSAPAEVVEFLRERSDRVLRPR
ncbi:DJ-1/PfpI family protein [Nocardiopsis aegyptia]|uniref:Transcriptional regulator GlxA family with amidase domain n=1 Tax=Nocardiopsis aegyptia TaxID=220378 RepID=A0A7Z0ETU9_9ACTN|nr:DJ-1/PfpI family protein [Nocardiopsis aegyptia]NYJ38079.1 transcriptional regulator GlxA family with amidase domain [Nocardiopsis aegyptia]